MALFLPQYLSPMSNWGIPFLNGESGFSVGVPTLIFRIFLFSIVAAPVVGAFFHIFVYIVGGRKGITQTIKAFMYGQTPNFLLGWIPIIPIIVGIAPLWLSTVWSSILSIWSSILFTLGIRQLHEITTRKAILAVLMPFIICGIIALAIIIVVFVYHIPLPIHFIQEPPT